MEKAAYIDTNIFTKAILDTDKQGDAAREILTQVVKNNVAGFTSTLTFDEVFWKIKKNYGHSDAVKMSRSFLEIPRLQFIDADLNVIWSAQELLEQIKLDPRDAIHAASAMRKGVKIIVSEDKDFDTIEKLKRVSLEQF